MTLDISGNEINVDEFKIILPDKTKTRFRIIGDSGEGKSLLTSKLEQYENVVAYYDTEINYLTIEAFNNNSEIDLLVMDECTFTEKTERQTKEAIFNSHKLIIIISRIIKLANTPVLKVKTNSEINSENIRGRLVKIDEYSKVNDSLRDKIIISEVLTVEEFKEKFKNYDRTLIDRLIAVEDSTSGFVLYKMMFKDTVVTLNGIYHLQEKIDRLERDNPNTLICLVLDFIPDNSVILETFSELRISKNFYLLTSHCVEEIIYTGLNESMLQYKQVDRYQEVSRKFKDQILKEIKVKHNTCSDDVFKFFKMETESFEKLIFAILKYIVRYNKGGFNSVYYKKYNILNKNNDLYEEILDNYPRIDIYSDNQDFTNNFRK
jgi:hypothetical protein